MERPGQRDRDRGVVQGAEWHMQADWRRRLRVPVKREAGETR